MRRREKVDPDAAPVRLRRFDARDWPDGCHPACSFWAGVFEWMDEHPDRDVEVDGPDVPFHEETI